MTNKSNDLDDSADEESGSDDSDRSVLENSDSEDDDGQLESLSTFVDSLRSQSHGPKPETNTEVIDSVSKGWNSIFQLTYTIATTPLSMNDILSSLTDPSLQSLRKSLEARQSSKSKSAAKKLSAPLAKPLQKKLERQAAYEETKTEITKWQPLVKANREVTLLTLLL